MTSTAEPRRAQSGERRPVPDRDRAPRALVVGLGIAGISTAIALRRSGWAPTIVEKASARRKGGYFIGLFGMGRAAATHLGAIGELHDRRSPASRNVAIDRYGNSERTLGFADAPAGFGPWMMLRGDVERATFDALPDDIDIRYDTKPVEVWQNADGVRVTLENSVTGTRVDEEYELLVGADGIHSQVRRMVFGPEERFAHPLDTMICAFELPENPPGLGAEEGVIMTEVGRSFWVFPFSDHPATVLFTYSCDDPEERTKDPRTRLREVFGPEPYGEVMSYALDQLDVADEFLFDTTQQIVMDTWHRGRVVLVGDAAWCPTLYSGMGATSALGGADALGAALRGHPDDLEAALTRWEAVLRPKILQFQKQGATTGRKNFLCRTQKELDERTRQVKSRRRLITNPLFGTIIGHTPFIKNRNADLAAQI